MSRTRPDALHLIGDALSRVLAPKGRWPLARGSHAFGSCSAACSRAAPESDQSARASSGSCGASVSPTSATRAGAQHLAHAPCESGIARAGHDRVAVDKDHLPRSTVERRVACTSRERLHDDRMLRRRVSRAMRPLPPVVGEERTARGLNSSRRSRGAHYRSSEGTTTTSTSTRTAFDTGFAEGDSSTPSTSGGAGIVDAADALGAAFGPRKEHTMHLP